MVVQPDFLDHFKTKTLEAMLKVYRTNHGITPEVLPCNLGVSLVLRLWFHCQNRKAWVFPNMTPEKLAGVCHWPHDPGWLFNALVECEWIHVEEIGGIQSVRVHDWETVNATLIANWDRGRFGGLGGRPKKAKKTPEVSQENLGLTSEEPEKRREDKRGTPKVPKGTSAPPDFSSSDDLLLRVRALFRMRTSTPLDDSQSRAWKKNRGVAEAAAEAEWQVLEWWYRCDVEEIPAAQYRRRDIAQLLNHWNGEVAKARDAAERAGKIFGKKEGGGTAEPVGWRDVLAEHSPEMHIPETWGELAVSIQAWVRELMKKKGGDDPGAEAASA